MKPGRVLPVDRPDPALLAVSYQHGLLAGVTPADVTAIVLALVGRAKRGDPASAKLLLDRLCGSQAVGTWKTLDETESRESMRKMLEF